MQESDKDHLNSDQDVANIKDLLKAFYLKHKWKIKLFTFSPVINLLIALIIVIFSVFQLFNNNSQDEWYIYVVAIIFAVLHYITTNIRLSSIPYLPLMEHAIEAFKKETSGTDISIIELASSSCTEALIDEGEISDVITITESAGFRLLLPFIFLILIILVILSHSVFLKSILLLSYLLPTLIFINMRKEISHIGGLFVKVSVLNWASNFQKENEDKHSEIDNKVKS